MVIPLVSAISLRAACAAACTFDCCQRSIGSIGFHFRQPSHAVNRGVYDASTLIASPHLLGRGGYLDPDRFRNDYRRVVPKRRQVAQFWYDEILHKRTPVCDAK